ncbi:MAG TPA: GTPase HflX [Firmicutes bacterium]|nr:GTPase HflX [Bacillota bacterium]
MAELEQLLETAGGQCIFTAMQNRPTPDPRTFIGEGKAREIAELVRQNQVDLLVFDNEISPSQTRALEEIMQCRVIDRNALILDIFADRAKTSEGKLQVELAQYQYLLPRLSGMWSHLVRQTAGGGRSPIGTRGPGETQLETDRRHIRQRIARLQRELENVRQIRATQRRKRRKREVPLVALVGYTNAGKSTLLNALTGAGVHANDRLFDTLDPTTKSYRMEDGTEILISDTVGFIRKLPHHLVDAFKATLEELTYADVLVHVIDASSDIWDSQAQVVERLIEELGAQQTPRIVVFNKCDKMPLDFQPRMTGAVHISAKTGEGLEALLAAIRQTLGRDKIRVEFVLPYARASVLDMLYRDADVKKAEYQEEGIAVEVVCDQQVLGRLYEFVPQYRPKEEWED